MFTRATLCSLRMMKGLSRAFKLGWSHLMEGPAPSVRKKDCSLKMYLSSLKILLQASEWSNELTE